MVEHAGRGKPRVAITMGDAAGIGPEILVKALLRPELEQAYSFLIVGAARVVEKARKAWAPGLTLSVISPTDKWDSTASSPTLMDLASDLEGEIPWGQVNAGAGRLAARCIEQAVRLALAGEVDAVVTCPINKEALALAGVPFPGHTEFLAHLTGASRVVMMLAGARLRVSLVTIHCPLSAVSGMLSRDKVAQTILLTHQGLCRDFGLSNPRLAVAGFNPHGGEGGLFGREEMDIIAPAVEDARKEGVEALGPLPPDTVFHQAARGKFDAVVCMYHDQGLIPLKLLHFRDAVNVTLGLPIVRVSVDHGTAYDIAGKGLADPQSLVNAIRTAGLMAFNRAAWGKHPA